MRQCRRCKVEKDRSSFYKSGRVCKECTGKALHREFAEARLRALRFYSKGVPKCSCCGELRVEFLAFDHINGVKAGSAESGLVIRGRLRNAIRQWKYPDGIRVLCHNCNQSLGFYGYCPHAAEKEKAR